MIQCFYHKSGTVIISTLSHKRLDLFEKKLLNNRCAFDFLNFCVKYLSHFLENIYPWNVSQYLKICVCGRTSVVCYNMFSLCWHMACCKIWMAYQWMTGCHNTCSLNSYYYYFKLCAAAFKAYFAIWVRCSNICHQASPHMSPRESTQRRKVELRARNVRKFCINADLHVTSRDLLHAVKLWHENDGFNSPPKEGVLRIFSP
jgi:hypothetical protein